MKRIIFAALAGGLFGTGLLVSGMTNAHKVQGWLDIFGAWDPTLAFVMGGAILPMAIAWAFARKRPHAALGSAMPKPATQELDAPLIGGSVLFGAGWGLAGLCPGPAIAALAWGGSSGVVFVIAMLAGMMITPFIRSRISHISKGNRLADPTG